LAESQSIHKTEFFNKIEVDQSFDLKSATGAFGHFGDVGGFWRYAGIKANPPHRNMPLQYQSRIPDSPYFKKG
jgi:hypothetical protein